MRCCRAFGLALAIALLGCRSSGIEVATGAADAGFVADLPGVADSFVLTDAAAKDVQTFFADAAPVEALSGKDGSTREDAMSLADSASDVAPDVAPDVRLASDPIAVVDGTREGSPAPSDALDVKLAAAEVSSDTSGTSDSPLEAAPDGLRVPPVDSGSEVPALPQDVTIHAAKDFSDADPQCVAATPGWLSLIATFLAESRKCDSDSDCTYASFGDGCGEICALPMNWQRIGDLGNPIYAYAASNCTTCPRLPSYPSCSPPTTMFCNAGRCEYKR
jgi:hypothetical protein